MSEWKTVSFNEELDHEEMPDRGHSFIKISKHVQWPPFCRTCGHIPLKNAISTLVTKLGCRYKTKTQYVQWLSTLRRN